MAVFFKDAASFCKLFKIEKAKPVSEFCLFSGE
jgi:hypothetical protein